VDHVVPKSLGGKDTWDNLVACCLKCNNQKSNKTLKEMGWELKVKPKMPNGLIWSVRGVDKNEPQWEEFLAMQPQAA
jgi:5-methylcytosine-specific restriction endonuclease McrA